MKMRNYLLRIKYLVDSLGHAGWVVSVEDHIIHMLDRLTPDYDLVVMILSAKRESYTVAEVSSLLLQNKKMLEDQVNVIENFVANLTMNSNNQIWGGYTSSNKGYYNNGQRGGYTSYNQGG